MMTRTPDSGPAVEPQLRRRPAAATPFLLLVFLLLSRELLAACPPVGSPPNGARLLQPGHIPQVCSASDAPYNETGATNGYYWSTVSCQWLAAPYCHARWGLLQASPSQVIDSGDTVTVTAIPDDGRIPGLVATRGGMTWSYPGTAVSGCGTTDTSCTTRIGEADDPPAEWAWHEFHVSGPGRVFILPPSYGDRCQAANPCLDTYTNAWSYVGVRPGKSAKGPFRVTFGAAAPRPEGVRREEEIRYRIAAISTETAKQIDLVATLPESTTLVPGSESGAKVAGRRLSWRFPDTASALVEFRVTVDKDLPRARQQITAAVSGVAKVKKRSLRDAAKAATPVLVITEIAGTVHDIALRDIKGAGGRFRFPRGRVVATPGLGGAEVRLLQGDTEVKSVTTANDGRYSLQIDEAGSYTLEFRSLADLYSPSTQTVDSKVRYARDRFALFVKEDGSIVLDNHEPEAEQGNRFRLDVSLGVSLMHQVAELIHALADYDYKYLFVFPVEIDLSPLMEAFAQYDVSQALALVDKVTNLDFIQTGGSDAGHKAHFQRLYQEGDAHDGWNALIRLSFLLTTMRERLDESIKLGDDMAKTLAVAVTAHYIANVLPNVPKKLRFRLPNTPTPALADKLTLKSKKIGSMAWGIGVGLPVMLDLMGVSGPTKAKVIETVAKATRYGIDAYGFRQGYLPDDLLEDLAFEVMFVAIRIGVLTAHVALYIDQTQSNLDQLTSLQLGAYGGDTRQALAGLEREGGRIAERTRTIHTWWTRAMLGISLIRGADGVTDTLSVAGKLAAADGDNRLVAALKGLGRKTRTFMEDKKFSVPKDGTVAGPAGKLGLYRLNNWITVAVTAIVGTIVDEGVLRWGDVALLARLAGTGDSGAAPQSVRRQPLSPEPAAEARAPLAAAASVPLQALLERLDDLAGAVRRGDTAAYDGLLPELESAYDGFFGPLETAYGRASSGIATAAVEPAADLLRFVGSMEEAVQSFSITLAQIDAWRALDGPRDLGRVLVPLLRQTAEYVSRLDSSGAAALTALEGLTVPGTLWITPATLPDSTAIQAGADFELRYTVQNPGDDVVAAGTTSLLPGKGIELAGAAEQPFPQLAAGASAELVWRVRVPKAPAAAATSGVQIDARSADGRSGLYDDLVAVGD